MNVTPQTEQPEIRAVDRAREREEEERELRVREAVSNAFLETALARKSRMFKLPKLP